MYFDFALEMVLEWLLPFIDADFIAVLARKVFENAIHPRFRNLSDLLSPASSSSLDSVSTWLPQAPADYCGLCIIEAPGGIRLVYWVCTSLIVLIPLGDP